MKVVKIVIVYDSEDWDNRKILKREEEVLYTGENEDFIQELLGTFEKHFKRELLLNTSVEIGNDLLLSHVFIFQPMISIIFKKCTK